MALAELNHEIAGFIKHNSFVMRDVKKSAEEAQQRIDAAGFKWDAKRGLWRHPNGRNNGSNSKIVQRPDVR